MPNIQKIKTNRGESREISLISLTKVPKKPPEPMSRDEQISEICRYIKEGWIRSFKFQWEATGEYFKEIKPEHLITVNIAHSIVDPSNFGRPFIIKLEESTNIAFNECFELMKKVAKTEKFKFIKIDRKFHNSTRNGKFDIVLYAKAINSHKEHDTRYVIEVKGFNQKRSQILRDINRICELADLVDAVGNSSFIAGFVTFAKSYKQPLPYDDAKKKHLKKCLDLLSAHDKKNTSVEPIVFEISSHLPTGDHDIDQGHCFIGTILIIKRNIQTPLGGLEHEKW